MTAGKIDPLTAIVALLGSALPVDVNALREWARKLGDHKTEAFREFWNEERDGWIVDLVRRRAEIDDELRELSAELQGVREEQTKDRQYLRLVAGAWEEGEREPLEDRRSLLACVTASMSDPHMTIAEKARAWRTIRELDGEDLLALYAYWRAERRGGSMVFENVGDRRDALLAAGTVIIGDVDPGPFVFRNDPARNYSLAEAERVRSPSASVADVERALRRPPLARVSSLGILVLRAARVYLRMNLSRLPFDLALPSEQGQWIEPSSSPPKGT